MHLMSRAPRLLRVLIVVITASFMGSALYVRLLGGVYEPVTEVEGLGNPNDKPNEEVRKSMPGSAAKELATVEELDVRKEPMIKEGGTGGGGPDEGGEQGEEQDEEQDGEQGGEQGGEQDGEQGGEQDEEQGGDKTEPEGEAIGQLDESELGPDLNSSEHHEDISNTDRYNVSPRDFISNFVGNASGSGGKSKRRDGGRWDLTGMQKEVVEIEGHKIILHHGSNFYMLDKYPVANDTTDYVLDKQKNIKLCSQKERTEFLHKKCKEHNLLRWDEMGKDEFRTESVPNLLVDDQHKILFCQTLKKHSTNKWIKFFGVASGKVEEFKKVPIHHMETIDMKGLREYEPDEIRQRLRDYTKFIVVRHPYRRLANIWDDDFRVEGTATRWRLGPQLIQKYHGKGSYKHGDMLEFDDFVRYVTSGMAESYYGITNMEACQPCLIGYDYIRRIESGPVDSMDILKKLQIFDNPIVRDAEKHHGMRALSTSIRPLKEMPQDLQDKLHKMFKLDVDLFGYKYENERATCEVERPDGSLCC